MIRLAKTRIVSLSVCLLLSVAAAGAADDQRPASRGGSQTSDPQQGPLVLEPITGGLVIAPDVKVTRIDGDTRALVGVYGGWVFDSGLLVGGGLYGEADGRGHNDHDRDGFFYPDGRAANGHQMSYGGFIVGWMTPDRSRVHVGVRALVGGGRARRDDVSILYLPSPGWDPFDNSGRDSRFWQRFFVAEPQADVAVRLSRHVALDIAGGYRVVAAAHGMDRQLRGPSGSISLQIGRF